MTDTKALIEQARCYVASEWGSAAPLLHKMADTIARLEAERDAARREAMEECARMADEYATWGGSNFAEWFQKLAAAIRAAMKEQT